MRYQRGSRRSQRHLAIICSTACLTFGFSCGGGTDTSSGGGSGTGSTQNITSDLNDDGIPDIVVSAAYDDSNGDYSGSVYVFFGNESMPGPTVSAAAASVKLMGSGDDEQFGSAVATGDVNGDGVDDLLVSSPRWDLPVADAGAVLIFLGPLSDNAVLVSSEADITLTGAGTVAGSPYGSMGDHFGDSMDLGDINGDGALDLLVGAPGADFDPGTPDEIEDAGCVYVFLGGNSLADRGAADANTILWGEVDSEKFGSAVCAADIDGDGKADLAIAGEVDSPLLYIGGFVHIFRGQGLASGSRSSADLRLDSEEGTDEFGSSIACGLINSDGIPDLVIGAPKTDTLGTETGRVYVFFGSSGFGGGDASLADAIYSGYTSKSGFGVESAVADLNGDGFDDVLIGSPRSSFGAQKNGRVFVFYGGDALSDELASYSDIIYTGEPYDYGRFGSAIEVLDCDGDGIADLMSSAPAAPLSADVSEKVGRVYLFRGSPVLSDTAAADDDFTLTGESEGGNFGFSISRGN